MAMLNNQMVLAQCETGICAYTHILGTHAFACGYDISYIIYNDGPLLVRTPFDL